MPRPKISYKNLRNRIQKGDGQGHGENYSPWIQIRRWNASPISTQKIAVLPPHRRSRSFLSQNEWYIALVLTWLGVEFREQYPLWPWPHLHSLYGLNLENESELPNSVGMIDICKKADIKHGIYPGTSIPFIWSADFMLTLKNDKGDTEAAMISVKSTESDRYQNNDPLDRLKEKLECERRYCNQLSMQHLILGKANFKPLIKLLDNLNHLVSSANLPIKSRHYTTLHDFLDRYAQKATTEPICEWKKWLISDGNSVTTADFIVKHIIWNQYIDFNLINTYDESKLPPLGGKNLKFNLYQRLFSEGSLCN